MPADESSRTKARRVHANAPRVHVERVRTTEDLTRCLDVRRRVFIDEQHVPESDEIDDLDVLEGPCRHFIARENSVVVGTARLWLLDDNVCKAQRVAVLAVHRNRGVGALLMRTLEDEA